MSSSINIVKNVNQITNGKKVPVLDFVRQYTPLAAAVSKAIPGTERVTRDEKGDRKISSPDYASMISIHRNISRRNKDAKLTLQMLPDLKLAMEMIVALIMSPKDMFNDEVMILSDSSDVLPASIMQSMLQVTTDYYRKNHNLSEFLQRTLKECFGYQGAVPVAIIPENSLDNLINNYNANLSLESFKGEFDLERNIPHPIDFLGVPDYLLDPAIKNTVQSGTMKFGAKVSFNLEAYDNTRTMNATKKATSANAGVLLSKLMPGKNEKDTTWNFNTGINKDKPGKTYNADELIFVTDNVSAMKLPIIKQASLESRVASIINKKGLGKFHASLEGMQQTFKEKYKQSNKGANGAIISDMEVENLLFKNRRLAHTPVATLRTNAQLARNSVGEPMLKIFDTSCFIPVSVMGDPTRKLGGFVMLDEEGSPLATYGSEPDEIVDLTGYAGGSGNFISSMNDRSNSLFNGKDCSGVSNYMLKKFFTRAFGEMVEKDMIDRIKNGQYDNGVSIADNEDFYWLMLTRCMKGQRTQLLWIPQEFLVYFAMDYDEMGFGKSLLDDIRNITSMRIMLMVSGIAASLRNSIGRTKVTVKLDEEDPDAQKSLEDIQDEILKSRMNPIPFGINNVADITKYLQRSCYEFEISGSTALPDMQVAFEQYQSNYPKPDEELQTQLKDLSIQHFGLTTDMIDAAKGVEFAIQAATNNRMTMKRIQGWQRILQPLAAEYIRKISFNSQSQIDSYRDILTKNFDQMQVEKITSYFGVEDPKVMQDEDFKKLIVEQCISVYIRNLRIDFPTPDNTTLETQKQQFDDAVEFYKVAIDYIVNESFFDTSIQGEGLSDHVDMVKNIILSHYMRDWMAKNGVLPELADLTTIGEDGKIGMDVMDALEKHIKALGMSTQNFFSRFKKFALNQTSLMSTVPEGSTEGETESSGSSGGDDSSSGGDDLFGDDEFGASAGDGDNADEEPEPGAEEDEEPADGSDTSTEEPAT